MSKWIVIGVTGFVVACACWIFGEHLWDVVVAMHGGH
jgi:hypothetical protein